MPAPYSSNLPQNIGTVTPTYASEVPSTYVAPNPSDVAPSAPLADSADSYAPGGDVLGPSEEQRLPYWVRELFGRTLLTVADFSIFVFSFNISTVV
jgi:hypothetical protein